MKPGPLLVVTLALLLGGASCTKPEQLAPAARPAAPWAAPLVSPDEVPALDELTILDARDKSDYAAGHLPGARRADWKITREGVLIGGVLAPVEEVDRAFEKLGVHDGKRVLVCGAGRAGWGEEGRIAWTLRTLGHPAVALLDGGCAALKARGWTKEVPKPVRGVFTAQLDAELRATREQVVAALKDPAVQLLDVRTRAEFEGATPWFEARGGHIPGAKNLVYTELLDDEGRALGRAALEEKLRAAGLDPARPIVAYCTGGVRSALATEVLRARGFEVRNYDGSFWQWAADDSLPVE